MKTTNKLIIEISVSFEDWDENPQKCTKQELVNKTKEFLGGYFPMRKTTFGSNSGELVVELKSIK